MVLHRISRVLVEECIRAAYTTKDYQVDFIQSLEGCEYFLIKPKSQLCFLRAPQYHCRCTKTLSDHQWLITHCWAWRFNDWLFHPNLAGGVWYCVFVWSILLLAGGVWYCVFVWSILMLAGACAIVCSCDPSSCWQGACDPSSCWQGCVLLCVRVIHPHAGRRRVMPCACDPL